MLCAMAPQDEGEMLRLVRENNHLLRKIRRGALIERWIQVIWYMLLIGLPFALYFYVLEPYFAAFGGSFSEFQRGVQELPGLKALEAFVEAQKAR